MDPDRDRQIRETWHAGWLAWNPYINGRGEPLQLGDCEFRLEHREIDGQMHGYIVCEGLVVELSPYEPI